MSPPPSWTWWSKYIGGGEDAGDEKAVQAGGARTGRRPRPRAKKAVKDLAKGLIQLYAQRQRQPGFAFFSRLPLAAGV